MRIKRNHLLKALTKYTLLWGQKEGRRTEGEVSTTLFLKARYKIEENKEKIWLELKCLFQNQFQLKKYSRSITQPLEKYTVFNPVWAQNM